MYRRVKIYDKVQAFLQTKSATSILGMNTDAIFYPTYQMSRKLQEAEKFGITRIEISYYADSFEAYKQYHHPEFLESAQRDIDNVQLALNVINSMCFKVSINAIFEAFQSKLKNKQFFVLQPDVCALVYAKGTKNGFFTGFYHDISKTNKFHHMEFLA